MNVTLHTTLGDINITMFPDHAPKTVANFVGLAKGTKSWNDPGRYERDDPLYDGLVFHRVISGFMIQGGGPRAPARAARATPSTTRSTPKNRSASPTTGDGQRRYRDPITGKAGGTNGSQFFITLGPTPHLQGKHTIFGQVADQPSRDVVDTIGAVRTGGGDKPVEPVVVTSVTSEG